MWSYIQYYRQYLKCGLLHFRKLCQHILMLTKFDCGMRIKASFCLFECTLCTGLLAVGQCSMFTLMYESMRSDWISSLSFTIRITNNSFGLVFYWNLISRVRFHRWIKFYLWLQQQKPTFNCTADWLLFNEFPFSILTLGGRVFFVHLLFPCNPINVFILKSFFTAN